MSESVAIRSGLGPIELSLVRISGNDLGTTPIKPALQDTAALAGGMSRVFKVRIKNLGTGVIAWSLVPRGTLIGAVVLNAIPAVSPSVDTGCCLSPGETELVSYTSAFELVLVAAAAASPYNLASSLY